MKVKKIAALAIGAAMVGATMGLASAQESMPPKSFFVNADGTPNVKIVVGSNAAAMDVASAADIAVALGSLLYTKEQTDAQADYVKIKVDHPAETVAQWTIYAYDYQTMTRDHGMSYGDSDFQNWATDYDQLGATYWWNGAYDADGNQIGFVYNYTEWSQAFSVPVHLENKDSVDTYNDVNWHITLSNIQLSADNWGGTIPPKSADLVIGENNVKVFVDYVLYNYSITTTVTTREAMPEWGISEVTDTQSEYYIGDTWEVQANGGSIVGDPIVDGVREGDTFTVFGKEYTVLEIPDNTTFVGGVYKGKYSIQRGSQQEIDGWKIVLEDITLPGIGEEGVFVTVYDPYGNLAKDVDGNDVIKEFVPLGTAVEFTGSDGKKIRIKPTNVFVGMDPENVFADIEVSVNIQTFTSGEYTITYDGKSWVMYLGIADEGGTYVIKNVTLYNKDELKGNPVDIFGKYDLGYRFESKTLKEADVDYDINGDGDKEDTLMVAYAYVYLKEKEGWSETVEFQVGDDYNGGTISAIETKVMTNVVKPVSEPITYMDFEINMDDPGANLILIGGPVANTITKWLVDQGISQVDWYNSPGDIEYLQDVFGNYDVVIVAGATRNETRAAAKKLMDYLAGL
ncbi:S-layer protein [Thermococcus sp. M36]|uniref:S-layer protein n=1 Tax=Thermococcus sp. M36 TaxID=1638261 RepID=UPI00143BFC58|nr:S-layer protein [Thermococcus sp. M36]NJE06444.1 S-layer protein [Thermococcus sp. M36]